MTEVYGISNCDTVKKTKEWLKQKNIAYTFHDFKIEKVSTKKLEQWINKAGLEIVLNKKSATWRNLPVEVQAKMKNKKEAIKIMQDQTSIIKRPVIEFGEELIVGFDEIKFLKILIK